MNEYLQNVNIMNGQNLNIMNGQLNEPLGEHFSIFGKYI